MFHVFTPAPNPLLCRIAEGRGGRGGGVGTHAVSGPDNQARPDTRLSPASAPRSRQASSRARACPRRCAAAAMASDLKLGGRGGGCAWGARPRAFLRPIPPISSRPGPQDGNPDLAALSGLVSADISDNQRPRIFPATRCPARAGSRQSPCLRPAWPGGGRRPGSAFGSHSSRDCQQARRWCSSRLRPGTCRAAPQRSARFPRRHAQNIFVCRFTPRHGTRGVA